MDSLPNSNDPYVILNVKYYDSKKDIKRAYVKLIKKYKPEKFPKEFQKIRRAYEEILKYKKYSSPKNPIYNPLNTTKVPEKTPDVSTEEKSPKLEDKNTTQPNPVDINSDKTPENSETNNEQESYRKLCEQQEWQTNIPEINFDDLEKNSLNADIPEVEINNIEINIPEIKVNDLHLHFFADIDKEDDTSKNATIDDDKYIEEEYKKFKPVFDTFFGDGFEDIPVDDESTPNGYTKTKPSFDTFFGDEFADFSLDTKEQEYQKIKPTFDTFYIENEYQGAEYNTPKFTLDTHDEEQKSFDYIFRNGLPAFEEVYFVWLEDREKVNTRMVDLFPDEANAYIFAFLLEEIGGSSIEQASKWLKLAIHRGIDIFDWLDEVLTPKELSQVIDKTFAWDKLVAIKTRQFAKAKLENYIHFLLYYGEHNRALSLIDNDLFFDDTWHFPQLGLVEIALEVSGVLAWYDPQAGEKLFQKYTGASSKNIEYIAKDAYTIAPSWMKIQKRYRLRSLRRFLALSCLSLENIDFAIHQMYVSLLNNDYLPILRTMEKEHPLFLPFLLGQIAKHSQDSVITRIDDRIQKDTFHYLFSSRATYNNICGILTTLLGFFSISGIVYIIYCLIAIFNSFHWGYFLSIFAIPLCVVGIVKLLNRVEKHSYEKWLCPKVAKLAVHTFYDFNFVANKENVNISFCVEDDPALLVLQQMSLLGKRFFRKELNSTVIFKALIYQEKRKDHLPMRDFCIFTQMKTIKYIKNSDDLNCKEKSAVNSAIQNDQQKSMSAMYQYLVKFPQKFLREMGIVDRRYSELYNYYTMYLRKQAKDIEQPRPPIFPQIALSQPAAISATVVAIITTLLLYVATEKLQGSVMLAMSLACLSFVVVKKLLYYKKIRLVIAKFVIGTKITPKQLIDCIMQKDLREYVKRDRVIHAVCWTVRTRL